jgi:hypothetical protein
MGSMPQPGPWTEPAPRLSISVGGRSSDTSLLPLSKAVESLMDAGPHSIPRRECQAADALFRVARRVSRCGWQVPAFGYRRGSGRSYLARISGKQELKRSAISPGSRITPKPSHGLYRDCALSGSRLPFFRVGRRTRL